MKLETFNKILLITILISIIAFVAGVFVHIWTTDGTIAGRIVRSALTLGAASIGVLIFANIGENTIDIDSDENKNS